MKLTRNRHSALLVVVDLLRVVSKSDRLYVLVALQAGRQAVSDLTQLIFGDRSVNHCSQMSRELTPMRQVGLISRTREGRSVFYELTERGSEIISFVMSIYQDLETNHADSSESRVSECKL